MNYPKVLIIGAEPYKETSSSRFLSSFFGNWPEDRIAHLYTVNTTPIHCFCKKYYRITDHDVINAWLHRSEGIGKPMEPLDDEIKSISSSSPMAVIKKKKDLPIIQTIRAFIWKEKFWHSQKLDNWIEDFKPDVIFCTVGRKRIANIAMVLAKRYAIPVVGYIPDDYYFKYKHSSSCIERFYSRGLSKITKEILSYSSWVFFQCEQMKKSYQQEFKCDGDVIYFSSGINPVGDERRDIDFLYCGAIEYGRWRSLLKFGEALQKISLNLKIDVYTRKDNNDEWKNLDTCAGIRLHDPISYAEVCEKMLHTKYVVHIEDFAKENIKNTQFSLSTKIADCLSCGACTIGFGPATVGAIDYLKNSGGAFTCTDSNELEMYLRDLLEDDSMRIELINKAQEISAKNHNKEKNWETVRLVMQKAVK